MRFEKFEGKDGQWYFRAIAPNNRTIFPSEGYVSEANVDRAIQMVKDYGRMMADAPISIAPRAPKFSITAQLATIGQVIIGLAKKGSEWNGNR